MNRQADLPVACDGHGVLAMCLGKKNVPATTRCTLVENGRRYYFSSPVARLLWRAIPERRKSADAQWAGNELPAEDILCKG